MDPIRRIRTLAGAPRVLGLLLAAAACGEVVTPAKAPPASAPAAPSAVAAFACRADVAARTVDCQPAPAGSMTGTRWKGNIVGGQGLYVRLASSNIDYTSQVFSFNVTMQNLSDLAWATTDGSTRDAVGVRVFFDSYPITTVGTGTVYVSNATGTDVFTGVDQAYFQYGGTIGGVDDGALGSDGILSSTETSASKRWELAVPSTVTSFAFVLYLSAAMPSSSIGTVAPQVSSISPDPMVTSSTVTLTGINFSATPAENVVTIGGTSAPVTSATTTQLQVTVPCEPENPVAEVQVTTNGLKGAVRRFPLTGAC